MSRAALPTLAAFLSFFVSAFSQATCSEGNVPPSFKLDFENDAGNILLQRASRAVAAQVSDKELRTELPAPFWPFKGGNSNRTGASPYTGVFDLAEPTWSFEEPERHSKGPHMPTMKVFHGTPIIDGEKNVYIQSTTGWVYSLTSDGKLRWSFETSDANPGNLAFLEGVVYTISQDGTAFAIEAASGKALWQNKVCFAGSADTHSLVAVPGFVILACSAVERPGTVFERVVGTVLNASVLSGSTDVCALRADDGQLRWTFRLRNGIGPKGSGLMGYNEMPAVVDGSVVFSDYFGGVYRVSLEDGKEQWYVPGGGLWFSTAGGVVVGADGRVYVAMNRGRGQGMLRVHDLSDGAVLWNQTFSEEINAGVAVGPSQRDGPTAVVVAVGNNVECAPHTGPPAAVRHAKIQVIDSQTQQLLWGFDLPASSAPCAGIVSLFDSCCPDVFGNPTIGIDGSVFVNWSGGFSYALRDANGDGRIDMEDPAEFSSYHHGGGSNGNSAIAPGLVVVPSCWKIFGFTGL
ncbi:unnamed protein product [Polarella glacialis]|uniref:Pyrrolo-quinoline quinone repeat domain-containing protein n=1 Tax=Polarella glacialis TaxID=89957 RepID=A0A813HYU9_POLGL|nr:unnamed protein product [Polarella glacialis]